jgi:hypothetical protein
VALRSAARVCLTEKRRRPLRGISLQLEVEL